MVELPHFSQNQYVVWLFALGLILIVALPNTSQSEDLSCLPKPPYEAPQYIAPPPVSKESKLHLLDNGDGTLTDPDTGLMWVQKDSYADLNRCLSFTESLEHVKNLRTGGHADWRVPTIKELTSIFNDTQENVMAWDHDPEYPLALDQKFADGAAYWYWSSDCGTTILTECCAKTLYFVNGLIELRRFELCNNGGVRAVRNIPQILDSK